VELRTEVRPSLIGGVVAESEGQEIELSIQGQLKGLAGSLKGK
jgi:F0F1-type ATP synthase delta subunit